MPTCCARCEQLTDCTTVVFLESGMWDTDTRVMLCDLCYSMYSTMYEHRVEEDDDEEDEQEEDEQEEDGENPSVPDMEMEMCDDPR